MEVALFKAVKERLGGRCCEEGCEDSSKYRQSLYRFFIVQFSNTTYLVLYTSHERHSFSVTKSSDIRPPNKCLVIADGHNINLKEHVCLVY